MRRAAIVAPVRTAVGTFGGSLRPLRAEDLAVPVVQGTVARAGIDPERIEDVVFAQSYANSEAPCIGRWVALHAGLPIGVPGLQIDRRCGGGLQAVITAAMMVQTGAADVVLAGGVESMSNIEHYTTTARWGARSGNQMLYDRLDRGREMSQPAWRFGPISGMIETAENLAADYGISREAADEFAARSHRRARAAQQLTSTGPAMGRPPCSTPGASTPSSPPPTSTLSPPTKPTAGPRSSSRSTPTSKTPRWPICPRGDSPRTPPGWCAR